MTGLVVPVYNRHEYVAQCFDSLSKVNYPEDFVMVMIDDCSTDIHTRRIFENFRIEGVRIIKLRNNVNKGVNYCLKASLTKCISLGCDVFINLDSDTIVKPEFINVLLQLKKEHPRNIITGFNCKMLNSNGVERHPVLSQHETYCIKKSIGGVNMCFGMEEYRKYVSPALDKPPDWDYYTCLFSLKDGNSIICATPSVIQHIGLVSSLGHSTSSHADVAYDFEHGDNKYKNKIIIPSQIFGLGDIIWEQTLIHKIAAGCAKVIWPVESHFVEGLNRAYPSFTFIDKDLLKMDYKKTRTAEYHLDPNTIVLPLQWSDTICKVPYRDVMKSKYIMYDMEWQIWKEKAMWNRCTDREDALMKELGINDGKPYNLINKFFRSANTGVADINVTNDYENIEMRTMYGYSLFDWAKVIENASEIHTVSTSNLYLIEMLELKAKQVDLYVRKPDEVDFRNVDYILQSHTYIQHL